MPQVQMDKKVPKIGFSLVKITTEQFAIIERNLREDAEIDIQMNFRFAADNKQRVLGVFASFDYEIEGKQFLLIEAGCHFSINPDSWEEMLASEGDELNVPRGFLQHMAVLTVGTARGILHAKTENTDFNKFHLPPINLETIIVEDSIFRFDDK